MLQSWLDGRPTARRDDRRAGPEPAPTASTRRRTGADDPWDDPERRSYDRSRGERLRRRSRRWPKCVGVRRCSPSCVVDPRRRRGRAAGSSARSTRRATRASRSNFTVNAGRRPRRRRPSSAREARASSPAPRVPLVRRAQGRRSTLTPATTSCSPRTRWATSSTSWRRRPAQTFTKVTFPEGFTLDADRPPALERRCPRLDAADVPQAAASRPGPLAVPARGRHQPRGPALPRHLPGAGNEDEAAGRAAHGRSSMDRGRRSRTGIDQARRRRSATRPTRCSIVASLIEREAKVDEDRAQIARVIYNRLRPTMPLQIDATLLLRPGRRACPFDQLKAARLAVQHLQGAGPAADADRRPGPKSIQAALDPAPNPDPTQCPTGSRAGSTTCSPTSRRPPRLRHEPGRPRGEHRQGQGRRRHPLSCGLPR